MAPDEDGDGEWRGRSVFRPPIRVLRLQNLIHLVNHVEKRSLIFSKTRRPACFLRSVAVGPVRTQPESDVFRGFISRDPRDAWAGEYVNTILTMGPWRICDQFFGEFVELIYRDVRRHVHTR